MIELRRGSVVISRAGRDCGKPMMVTDVSDGFIYLSDGGERPLSRPKKKNVLHVTKTSKCLLADSIENDCQLRRKLSELFKEGV